MHSRYKAYPLFWCCLITSVSSSVSTTLTTHFMRAFSWIFTILYFQKNLTLESSKKHILTSSQSLLKNVFSLFCSSPDLSRKQAIEFLNLNEVSNSKDSAHQHTIKLLQLLRKGTSIPQVVVPNSSALKNQSTLPIKPPKSTNQKPIKIIKTKNPKIGLDIFLYYLTTLTFVVLTVFVL